jgi:hypothetical protein
MTPGKPEYAMSSNVKYSTVTWAPCFCARRCAAASTALLVGST